MFLSVTKEIRDLSNVIANISNEINKQGSGIWDMLKYFSTNRIENHDDIKVMEKAIESAHNINKELDNVINICNQLLSTQEKINTYLSKSTMEGDDLK